MNDKPAMRPTRNGHEFGLTKRIRELNRIPVYISIRIRLPTRVTDWVFTDESRCAWTVIPIPVVIQPGPVILPSCVLLHVRIGQPRLHRRTRRLIAILRLSLLLRIRQREHIVGDPASFPTNPQTGFQEP